MNRNNNRRRRRNRNGNSNNIKVVSAPLISSKAVVRRAPKVRMSGKTVVITNSEYLADLDGSVNYACTTYSINPGLPHVFKWLSAIASRYETYKFRKLQVVFHSSVGAATAGTIAMAVDFDAADPAPLMFQDIMSYAGAVSNNVWRFPVYDCKAGNLAKFTKDHFVRVSTLMSNLDIKTYDIGNLHVVTRGMAGASTVGYITLDYEVLLSTPQVQSDVNGSCHVTYSGADSSPYDNFSSIGTLITKLDTNSLNLTQTGRYWLEGFQRNGNDAYYMDIANILTDFYTNPNLTIVNDHSRIKSTGSIFKFLVDVLAPTHFGFNTTTYSGFVHGTWLMTHLAAPAVLTLSPETQFCSGWAQEAGQFSGAATKSGLVSASGVDTITVTPNDSNDMGFFEASLWVSAAAGLNAVTIAASANCSVDYGKGAVNGAGTEGIHIVRVKHTSGSTFTLSCTSNLGAGATESQLRVAQATPSYSITP